MTRGDPARFLRAPEPETRALRTVDAHVHLFPPRVFAALRRWFEAHAWPIRYPLEAEQVVAFLEAQGVAACYGLLYSHVPGMARSLNAFMTALAERSPRVIPFGTVLPGEPEAAEVVAQSLDDYGHAGLKIHCHVQKIAPDDPRLFPIYEAVAARGRVLVMHAGREPSSPAYGFDSRGACGVTPVRRVVERFPGLKLIVPHLGQDQWREFFALCRDAPNLHLDTTLAVGGFLTDDGPGKDDLLPLADRILFGTDFPNLAFPWALERDWLLALGLPAEAQEKILFRNALRLVGRGEQDPPPA